MQHRRRVGLVRGERIGRDEKIEVPLDPRALHGAAGVPAALRRNDAERKPRRRKLSKHRRCVGKRPDELRVHAVVVLEVGVEKLIVHLLAAVGPVPHLHRERLADLRAQFLVGDVAP